jgi:hypothetical protein
MKPTAPDAMTASMLATTPCRGLSLSRSAVFMGSVMATAKVEPLDMKLEVVVLGVSDVDGDNQIVQGERS